MLYGMAVAAWTVRAILTLHSNGEILSARALKSRLLTRQWHRPRGTSMRFCVVNFDIAVPIV